MPLPKRRHSPARRDKRRANWALKAPAMAPCSECRTLRPRHRACPNCGVYAGVQVMKGLRERVHRGQA